MQRSGDGGLGGGLVKFYLGGGAGFAELLGRGTALVLAPVNTVHFQGKCNLKATQAIQDIWYIMVNNKMFSSVQLALEKREG